LIDLLAKVLITQSALGRGVLLQGVPGSAEFGRDPGNMQLDLTLIIDQVVGLGQLDSGALPLVTLIQNTLPFAAPGTRTHAELESMRDSLRLSAPAG
jgi:hypothetical protein